MFMNNKMANSVRIALAFGAVSTAAFTANSAVAAEEDAAKQVERIEVTGSRIKRTDMENASPVLVLDREAINSAGQVSIGDILQQIPAAGAALNTAFNNGGNGSTNIDLRNLGAQRLLVLVNGRRWISGLDSTVDLNTIPTSAVERVEVLKDGASAIYGSDAIAGVVNIITRKDFEGLELSSYVGENASEGDGRKYTTELTLGTTNEKSGILINMSHTTQQEIMAGDREISSWGLSNTAPNTRIQLNANSLDAATKARMTAAGMVPNSGANYNYMVKEGTGANVGLGQFRNRVPADVFASEANDGYNFAPDNYLVTPQNRNSFYIQGFYDINDDLRFVSDFVYTNRKSEQLLAAMPVTLGEANGYTGSLVDIHADNIYNPFGETLYGSKARAIQNGKASNYVAYNLTRRFKETGGRRYQQDDSTYRGMVGLQGNITDTSWTWDAHYIYGQNTATQKTEGLINITRMNKALGANCTAINNCTPLNLFGGPGSITQDMLDYVTFDSIDSSGMTMKDYAFNTGGDLFELPGGVVGLAIGLERREENGFDNPDPLTVTGESSGNQRDATAGGFRLDEVYAELSIPVMENLLLTPAVRSSDHSAYGSNSTAKIGLEYRPIEDLLIRATSAEGYRSPSLSNLYAGNADSYNGLTDPCNANRTLFDLDPDGTGPLTRDGVLDAAELAARNAALPGCAAVPGTYVQGNTQIRVTNQSSPDLKPETSKSLTVGFVYNPSWLDGAELTVDYYNIEVEGAIARVGAGVILAQCALNASSPLCAELDRDPSGIVLDLRNGLQNQGSYDVAGVDTYIAYRLPESDLGSFKVHLDTSYFIKNKFNGDEQLGVQYGDGGYPRIKGAFGIDWMSGDWNANYQARYVHHMMNYETFAFGGTEADGVTPEIPSYVVHDISGTYNLSSYNAKVTLGVENLFAKEPTPEGINNAFAYSANNFSVTEYDVNMDRFVYLRATVKF